MANSVGAYAQGGSNEIGAYEKAVAAVSAFPHHVIKRLRRAMKTLLTM